MNKTYPNPFIAQRADPYILKAYDGYYYFTASYPAFESADNGYDRIILRRSKTIEGLPQAKEHTVWTAHKKGIMAKHIWAPEIHRILDKWYIFFAAGDSDGIWNIRPYLLCCEGDPINDPWQEPGKMQAADGDNDTFERFSLDMTYFEHKGRHYLIWAEIVGDSSLFISEIDPHNPQKLLKKPTLLTKPEYPWEMVCHRVNEGASLLKTKDKLYIFFSASGTGSEYCMGRLSADIDCDPTDPSAWEKLPYPVLETADLPGESGPGHNSFTTDEKGNVLLVYHSRPEAHLSKQCGSYCSESLYDPCRHARIRPVYFDDLGVPQLKK